MEGQNPEELKKELNRNMKLITEKAREIYDLIPQGMTMDITWQTKPRVIARGTAPVTHQLIITKPMLKMNIDMR